ncbi:DUF930 domain-containing protein [Rhizobium sp. PL01]|uniref:DUF930 domain-containing protein n=1 Tax=Rhizobium sp. PL01 TaxID=3085631 RepID=UPI00298231F1|nr:DUF930 domain-containing protein [Rhizobium sp. PL01]MDW5317645.1 DUF930 domain-containing protein [Rhizobium sp. PL01]
MNSSSYPTVNSLYVDVGRTASLPLRCNGARSKHRGWNWSVLASVIAHLVFGCIVLTIIPSVRKFVPPDDEGITVEMVSPQNVDLAVQPPIATERIGPVAEAPAVQAEETNKASAEELPPIGKRDVEPARMVAASQLYAAKILAAPRSKKVREALRKLATEEHMIQLCNIEAMEQVHRWNKTFQPDYLVAYAMSDPKMAATAIDAGGGAFRSRSHWYNIGFKCAVTADISRIVSFAFLVGSEIPKQEWRAHNLAPDDGPDD